jgi:hypothetical protein
MKWMLVVMIFGTHAVKTELTFDISTSAWPPSKR